MAKKKEKKGLRGAYLRLESLEDLAISLTGERSYALAVKSGAGYKLMCDAEQLGDAKIMLYTETKSIGRYLIYSADDEGEKVEIADDIAQRADRYKSQKIPIVEIAKDPYPSIEKGALKRMQTLEVKDQGALIRAMVNSMGEDESLKVYSFMSGGQRIIGTLTLINDHDKVFAYSKASSKGSFNTISYDYNSDTVELSKGFSLTPKIHIRVINLKDIPPFFKQ
jgi:hypothetical protein